jgi:hypothetical protein
LFGGLLLTVLLSGWWAFARGQVLLDRTDNARRTIADRFVRRGSLLDRYGRSIAVSQGAPGTYQRDILEPSLSNIIGYTHPVYGQSGLEVSLDPYLRGLKGYPARQIAWNNLLYGQPPPGLDVRLSIDLTTQEALEAILDGNQGALVLLDAVNGEVLSMISNPGFDANLLDEKWDEFIKDPELPLINRASQGAYAPPEALLPFLGEIPSTTIDSSQPDAPLEAPVGVTAQVSPLEIANIASALTNGGTLHPTTLALAVDTPLAGWILIPTPDDANAANLDAQAIEAFLSKARIGDANAWAIVSTVPNGPDTTVTWFVGGFTQGDNSQAERHPLALAFLLEQDNPELAWDLGKKILALVSQQAPTDP